MIGRIVHGVIHRIRVWPHVRLVRAGLGQWDIDVGRIDLMSWSENQVYSVRTDAGPSVVARLHRPRTESDAAVQAESIWLEALHADGVGVGPPVFSRDGRSHVPVGHKGESIIHISVMEWVEGETAKTIAERDPTGEAGVELSRRRGALLAQLHDHGGAWVPPTGFAPRERGIDAVLGARARSERFWEIDVASPRQQRLLGDTREALRGELLDVGTGPDDFGLVHGDLSAENVLVSDGGMVAIDFEDLGRGWYLDDIAAALNDDAGLAHFDAGREAFLEGYCAQRALTDEQLRHLPTFEFLRRLIHLGWVNDRPELDRDGQWLAHELAVAEILCDRFLS